jgi:hypothetical protein
MDYKYHCCKLQSIELGQSWKRWKLQTQSMMQTDNSYFGYIRNIFSQKQGIIK